MKKLLSIALHAATLTLFCLILTVLTATAVGAQSKPNVIRTGNILTAISTDSGTLTKDIYVDKEGNKYPVYQSAKGKLYILRVSKKSGKEYKYYLTVS